MATFSRSGPRAAVSRHVAKFTTSTDPAQTWTEKPEHILPTPQSLPDLTVGDIRLYSYYAPGLADGTYTANITQTINIPGQPAPIPQTSTKKFSVVTQPWSLEPGSIHSLYPPPGHGAYSSVLPHVVFNNPQLPWMAEVEPFQLGAPIRAPSMALLVFTADELTPSPAQMTALQSQLGGSPLAQSSASQAFQTTVADLQKLDSTISQPISLTDMDTDSSTSINVIFLPSSLFDTLFNPANSDTGSLGTKADVSIFKYMSHVRCINVVGLPGKDEPNEIGHFSVTVSPRTGPLGITAPSTVYVHLVSLRNVPQQIAVPSAKSQQVTALVSLYSWSYSCLPPEVVSVGDTFRTLGKNIQPLRLPDSLWSNLTGSSPHTKWAAERMEAGYSVIRHFLPTGEQTIAVHRGPLAPTSVTHPLSATFPQQSNFGTDLAIVNKDIGIVDMSYQLAWQLGRSIAVSDRTYTGALARLRSTIHEQALAAAKAQMDNSFLSREATLKGISSTVASLKTAQSGTSGDRLFDYSRRWQTPPLGTSPRASLSFRRSDVRTTYIAKLPATVQSVASSLLGPEHAYNEFNRPTSIDYSTVMSWCLDLFFLHPVPIHYWLPDPALVPQETIRTFYVDENWIDVLVDGALSVGNYYTTTSDYIRTAIRTAFNNYLKAPLPNSQIPQIPKWGFFLRSSLVAKFPDLRIIAPLPDSQSSNLEILASKTLDQDLLMCFFDRTPDEGGFPKGITLQPPEHQLSFELGTELDAEHLKVDWKKVYADPNIKQDYTPQSVQLPPTQWAPTDTNTPYNFARRLLLSPKFAAHAHASQQAPNWPANPTSNVVAATPALVSAQLIADVPALFINVTGPSVSGIRTRQMMSSSPGLPSDTNLTTVPERPQTSKLTPEITVSCSPDAPSSAIQKLVSSHTLFFKSLSAMDIQTAFRQNSRSAIQASIISPSDTSRSTVLTSALMARDIAPGDLPVQLSLLYNPGILAVPDSTINFLFPQEPPPLLYDHLFLLTSTSTDNGWFIEYAEVSIPVGTRPTDMLLPFATGAQALQDFETQLADMAPVTPATAKLWNWPLKPSHSFDDVKLPIVFYWGKGQRWVPAVRYESEAGAPPGCGKLIVRMTPRTVLGRWNLRENSNLSFALERPLAVNWKLNQTYTVEWVEKYHDWPGDETLSGFARSSITVTAHPFTN